MTNLYNIGNRKGFPSSDKQFFYRKHKAWHSAVWKHFLLRLRVAIGSVSASTCHYIDDTQGCKKAGKRNKDCIRRNKIDMTAYTENLENLEVMRHN